MARLRPTLEFRRGDELWTSVFADARAVWFDGHFPGVRLMPGVAMLALVEESIALFWATASEPAVSITGYRRIRFRQMVEPGTTLRLRVRKGSPGSLRFSVDANGTTVCTGECSVQPVESSTTESVIEPARAPALDSLWAARADGKVCGDGLSFAAVAARAVQLAEIVAQAEPSRLWIGSEDRAEVAAAVLAAFCRGIELIFPPSLSPDVLLEAFRSGSVSHWLGPADWTELPDPVTAARIPTPWPAPSSLPVLRADLGRTCLHVQTGGSTGQPKVWSKTASNFLDEAACHTKAMQLDADDHVLATVPPYHIYGLMFSVVLPLVSRATVERWSPFFPQEIARQIQASAATILVSTPAHLRALTSCMSRDHHLRLVLSSGAPLLAADAAEFHARTGLWPLELYGSTETGGVAARRQDVADAPWLPLVGVDIRVEGESLCVRSPSVSATESLLDDGFFVTADRAELIGHDNNADNDRFRMLGRMDGIVKVGGQRVALPEIERALCALERVKDAVVLALPTDLGRGQEIVALAVSDRAAPELVRELREKLPSPAWPRRLRCVSAIPMTAAGKRDRTAILELLATAAES